jgi:hypothetical protein
MSEFPKDALIAWEGDSKEVISSFPDEAKQNLGFQLRLFCNKDSSRRTTGQ